MNKVRFSRVLYTGLLLMLSACQASGQPRGNMLKPGDTIDGMRLTMGAADAPPLWAFCSPAQHNDAMITSDCNIPALSKLAIGQLFTVADDGFYALDGSELTWDLSIDDQLVDLKAFGTFVYVMPTMPRKPSAVREVFKQFTAWDVVLTDITPGEHTLEGQARTDTDRYTWVIRLRVEGTETNRAAP